ncbi:STAS domain-containing protein [Aquabacter spiritensis]|uniref:Anti-anti-sigma factor n=1 Tax=Aquabacter spiritensis TaxID=933073 RepID=A0A4R3M1I4_9HYPH|nr:STAS domain-containing protein [Aquabacter spiritensis]TCT06573.1 anti-anti-sigma factor [Aquabacter spiritensis]
MPRLVQISGDMDAAGMARLKPVFEELAAGTDDVTLDLSAVEFVDSSGIGGLVFLYKRLHKSNRKLRLRGAAGQPLQLVIHLRLSDLIEEGRRP